MWLKEHQSQPSHETLEMPIIGLLGLHFQGQSMSEVVSRLHRAAISNTSLASPGEPTTCLARKRGPHGTSTAMTNGEILRVTVLYNWEAIAN